jgi:hypothetical protein
MEVRGNCLEGGFIVFETHDASLEACGCKNSKIKLPSKRLKGPEITGSWRGDSGAMAPSSRK